MDRIVYSLSDSGFCTKNIYKISISIREEKRENINDFSNIVLFVNPVDKKLFRHPHPGFRYEYRYRFHAPKHEKYDDSYAIFTTEKLEHYNWNYLDHYVCTGGYTTDFVLVDALKYWRLKIYFLNINHPGTKKILEGSEKCDIYSWAQNNDYSQVVEGYLKFVETAVNKIKKSNHVSKKPRMSLSIQTLPHLPQLRRNSVSSVFQNPSRLSDKVMASSLSNSSSGGPCLKQDCSSLEVIEAMKHSSHGLSFVTSLHGLPHHTFISADAVHWVLTNMENVASVEDSLKILERLLKENLIRHASGGYTKKFVYGFCLFYILPDKDEKDIQVSGDLESFETDFFEVEIKQPLNWGGTKQPRFLSDDVIFEYLNIDVEDPEYKRMRLDTDITNKSDRTEWGHVKYQTEFVPDRAYELTIEWLTSSGSIMSELLFGWHRKAQSCGLQMIPIPHDPFALPSSGTTDPLRAPIFVPLNVECLESDEMFKNFSKTDWELKLFLFKEAIIQRFGFVPSISETVETSKTKEYQYVHATGTIFIMISNTACKPERSKSTSLTGTRNATDKYTVLADIVPSPHEAYITRHVSNQRKLKQHSENIGFLWAWNHMISRRWRTNQGVDTAFQLKVLKDFRDFCGNCDNRLVNFWRDSCNSVLSS